MNNTRLQAATGAQDLSRFNAHRAERLDPNPRALDRRAPKRTELRAPVAARDTRAGRRSSIPTSAVLAIGPPSRDF